ncbi:violacein biosynthesis enzyme VioE [Burkholderia sp. AW49-1]
MLPDDQITSGYCWFDYARNICRIDGLFNPWSEKDTGHRLWMSEIGDAGLGQSHKKKVAYARDAAAAAQLCETVLANEVSPFHELLPSSFHGPIPGASMA